MLGIIQHYAEVQDKIQPFAGPGHWNDPDMVNGNVMLCAQKLFYMRVVQGRQLSSQSKSIVLCGLCYRRPPSHYIDNKFHC